MKVPVTQQGAGQKMGFGQDLKAVADTDDPSAAFRKANHFLHDGGKTGDRPAAQIIPVRKTTGQHHAIHFGKNAVFVPDVGGLLPQDLAHDVMAVSIAVGAGKNDDSEFHASFRSPPDSFRSPPDS